MLPRASCPDLTSLRKSLIAPCSAGDDDVLRAHVAECGRCRALLASLDSADGSDATMAYEGMTQAGGAPGFDEASPAGRSKPEGVVSNVSRAEAASTATIGNDFVTYGIDAPSSGKNGSGRAGATDASWTIFEGDARAPSETGSSSGGDDHARPRELGLENVTVPGYEILGELGRGGMGVVYKARHRRLHRLVALKMVLAGTHAGSVGLARFRAEAEAVAKLTHANIVQIYETGEHEGRPFFSLEYVEGGSLDQRLAEGPTSPRQAAQFVETLARAMEVAHKAGIVHRDLKPANILLARADSQTTQLRSRELDSSVASGEHWSRGSVPKIADFGLAKRTDDDSSQTQTGAILGTPSYMAPEQAGGKTRDVGPGADIYALGVILYELLVGRPPFRAGSPIDTIRQVLEQEPVPPRQLEPRVPLDLETICLKCLEKEPERRFLSAAALADELARFVEGTPIQSRPTPAWERAWKWCRRRPAVVALIGVVAAGLLSMALFIVWHNVSLRARLDLALADERRARLREQNALAEQRLALARQEGQKLFDGARVSVAASDWVNARLLLTKAVTTIGGESKLADLKVPAQELLSRVERELGVEAERRTSEARFEEFGRLRDEAQFLGTLYTGMDMASNLKAARSAALEALSVYGVSAESDARPKLDVYLGETKKSEITGDCAQLMLVLAETEAQSSALVKPEAKPGQLRLALATLEHAARLGAPVRAARLRKARYLDMLGEKAAAAEAEKAALGAPLAHVLDHFLMADELYRREKFHEASGEFDRVLSLQPGHFWAQYLNALCLLRQGRPAEAKILLSACLAQRSDFVWLYLLRGYAQGELQALAAADADFEKAQGFRLDENARYVLLVDRGVLRIRQGRFDDAVADLSAAIGLKPGAYQAYVNLALAHRSLGRTDQALDSLVRAIGQEPGLALLYRLKARLHLERDEPQLALASFDQAIERDRPDSPYRADDQLDRGRILLRTERHADALAAFDAALASKGDQATAQRLRAEALFRLKRFQEVIDAFNRYLETGKPLESVYRGRGLALAEMGKYPAAIEDFTKALELRPTPEVFAYRGWTHLVVDAPKLALRDFELAIQLDPKNADAYNGRGLSRVALGKVKDGVADAAEALRLGPASPRLLYNAARIYAQSSGSDPLRAIDLIRQALKLLPADQRRAFWSTHIRKDAAMASLRRGPLFLKIEADLMRGN